MRRVRSGFVHWCPACKCMHILPDRWQFNGNLDVPTFTPSFRQLPNYRYKECHYNITDGRIVWHADSAHGRSGSQPMIMLSTIDAGDDPLLWGEDIEA